MNKKGDMQKKCFNSKVFKDSAPSAALYPENSNKAIYEELTKDSEFKKLCADLLRKPEKKHYIVSGMKRLTGYTDSE